MARKSRQFQVPPTDLVDTVDGFVAGRQSLAEVRDRLRRTLAADPQQAVLLTLCVERAREEGRLGLAAADALLVLAAGTASEDIPTAGPELAAPPRIPTPLEPQIAPQPSPPPPPPPQSQSQSPVARSPAAQAPAPQPPAPPPKPAVSPAAATSSAATALPTSPSTPTPTPTPTSTPAAAEKPSPTGRRARGSAPTADQNLPPRPTTTPLPAPARHQAGLRPGAVLKDRYVLGDRLGGGGMAEIYKAIDRRREQAGARPSWVALKIVASPDDRSPAAEALKREAALAARLDHPNIVRVFGLDRDGSHLFLAMELLAGESLARRLDQRQQRPMPRLQVVPLIEGLCRGLAYLHGRGLVHGDIKPGNLFITADEQVKILDFGIARDLQAPAPATPRGRTAEYASCEVLAGEPPVPADDVYSVACVAYRMLAGHRPFGSQTAVEAEAAGRRPPVIEALPASQWHALDRALAFRRAERPPDLGQFIALFKGAHDEAEPPAAASAPAAATSEPPAPRWPYAGTWAAFVVVCAVGAAIVWLVPDHLPGPSGNPGSRPLPRQIRAPEPDPVPPPPAVPSVPASASDRFPETTEGAATPLPVLPPDEG